MKKQKGITLIALIITIIVMLILVGVTVNVALNGGLFDKAKQAGTGMDMAQIKERAEVVRYTLMIDLESGNSTIIGTKAEYIERLKTEFGITDDEVKENKVIVGNGKYDIIVKNADLDIEVVEHSDYVDTSSIVLLLGNDNNSKRITIDNKIYGINVSLDLICSIDEETYISQEFEKNLENKEELTDEEKKEEVLAYMSQQVSEAKGTETTIESTDEYFVELFNYMANEYNIATHDTLDSWFEDENFPQGIEMLFDLEEGMGEKIKTRSDLYNLYMENTDLTVEVTEGQFIEYIYTNEIQVPQENEERSTYVEEYNNNTKNLNLYVMYNGEREDIAENISVSNTPQEYLINKNGEYLFVLENSKGEILSLEIIQINNIETYNPYVLTKKDAKGIWSTWGDGTLVQYLGTDEKVIIPIYIGNEEITMFGLPTMNGSVFSSNITNKIKEVIIPGPITKINRMAFQGCTNLQSISLPNTLLEIGVSAFRYCENLSSITIPKSVTTIANDAFQDCTNLTNIYVEEGSTLTIPETAPWGATNATVTVLPAE